MRLLPFACAGALPLLSLIPWTGVATRQAFRDAAWHLSRQELPDAIARLEDVVRLDPGHAPAWFHLANAIEGGTGGSAFAASAAIARSREAYSRALQLGFGASAGTQELRIEALTALARSYSELPEIDANAAAAFAAQLSREFPGEARAQFVLARTLERIGRPEESAAAYAKLEAAFPGDASACDAVAEYHWRTPSDRQPTWQEALTRFERCAELQPRDPTGFYKVAAYHYMASSRAGLVDAARRASLADTGLAAADRALALKPDYTEAMIFKAMLLRVKAETATDSMVRAGYERDAAAVMAEARRIR
jgi:cytochrome c-type biogenesis protein CcmH/NrfG